MDDWWENGKSMSMGSRGAICKNRYREERDRVIRLKPDDRINKNKITKTYDHRTEN